MVGGAQCFIRAALRTGGGDGEESVVWVGDNVVGGCYSDMITPPVSLSAVW